MYGGEGGGNATIERVARIDWLTLPALSRTGI